MANNSARYQLLGQGGRGHGLGSGGMSGWGDNSDEEPDHTRDMSVPQIKQQQYQALEGE